MHRKPVLHLRPEQARELVARADPENRAAIALGLGTGMRQGEVFGLQVTDISWRRTPQGTVQQQLTTVTGNLRTWGR